LSYFLNSNIAKGQYEIGSTGAIQAHFNIETASNLIVPIPNLVEQKIILAYIETETAKIDYTISRIAKEIELMQEYRTALISEVVTGQVKVM
jgi:type I restriction enzyme, S subunit